MTSAEIKTEIQKTIEQLPEETLGEILFLLQELKSKPGENTQMVKFITETLAEDHKLLERLAQ